jgi:hypothetical protein
MQFCRRFDWFVTQCIVLMKYHNIPEHPTRIPEYWCHNLAISPLRLSTLWIRFIAFSSLGWLSIGVLWSSHVTSIVTAAPTLHTAFACPNIHAQYVQHVSLISEESQLSRPTSLYDHSKLFCGLFYVFVGNSLFRAFSGGIAFNAHFASF